jgi:hypothetical protein
MALGPFQRIGIGGETTYERGCNSSDVTSKVKRALQSITPIELVGIGGAPNKEGVLFE